MDFDWLVAAQPVNHELGLKVLTNIDFNMKFFE